MVTSRLWLWAARAAKADRSCAITVAGLVLLFILRVFQPRIRCPAADPIQLTW